MSKKKKKNKPMSFDWDSYKATADWEDIFPNPAPDNEVSDWEFDSPFSEEDSAAIENSNVEHVDTIIQSARSITLQTLMGQAEDEPEDMIDTEGSNVSSDAVSTESEITWEHISLSLSKNLSKSPYSMGKDDNEILTFQKKRPLSLKDIALEEDRDDFDNLAESFSIKAKSEVLNESTTPLPTEIITEQAGAKDPSSPIQNKKDHGHRKTLQDMQNAIMNQVTIITHNGGLYYYNGRTYKALGNSYDLLSLVRSRVSSTAFASSTTKQFFDLLVYLKTDDRLVPYDYQSRLARSKYMVVMKNGILDFSAKPPKLLPHKPWYLTFHEFDADYVENPNPRVFLRFLSQSSGGDPEIERRIIEAIGFLLSGLNHRCFFVAGTAQSSGKSTLGLLLQALIGDEQVSSISTHQLDGRFALGSTRNTILNISMDIPKGHLTSVAVSLIKTVTGGDPIQIEEKYQPTERIISNLRFLFGTNYPITVSQADDESAFWDRMVILPFTRSIPPHLADLTLLDKLIDEKDEIISYCLRALSRVLANNMQFSPCAVADQMKAEWQNRSLDPGSFASFWQEQVCYAEDPHNVMYSKDLYDAYMRYCQSQDLQPISYKNMKDWIHNNIDPDLVHEKRIHKTNSNPRAGYVGIHLSTQE